ncbi:MAG: hypothetical protein ACXVQY_04405 [Actinomycetota bacterium]
MSESVLHPEAARAAFLLGTWCGEGTDGVSDGGAVHARRRSANHLAAELRKVDA